MLIKKNKARTPIGLFGWWRIITMLVVGLMGGTLVVSAYFVYTNIFQTLDNANEVVVLRGGAHFEAIDTRSADKAEAAFGRKETIPHLPTIIRNPFYFASSTLVVPAVAPTTTAVAAPSSTPPSTTATLTTTTPTKVSSTPKIFPTSTVKR